MATRRTATFPGFFVEPDNELNGRLAADFLHSRGHKIPGRHFHGFPPTVRRRAWRVKSFGERAKELGLTVHNILGKARPGVSYLEIAPLHEESDTLVRRMMQTSPRPTGLYMPVDPFLRLAFPGPCGRLGLSAGARFSCKPSSGTTIR